ncbi:MAG: alpha-rhamnosidase [Clostridia bacterium]|nr:alpha-rhamnosidase [Clostridia bacterium]
MNRAHWIWYSGDFEIYHNILLHTRRQEFSVEYPVFWSLPSPYANVSFFKDFEAAEDFSFTVVCRKYNCGRVNADGKTYPLNSEIHLKKGSHSIGIDIMRADGFASIFIDSEYLITDGSWECCHRTDERIPAGHIPMFFSPEDDPDVFPFEYETLRPVKTEAVQGGVLYDYGKETFCRVSINGAAENDEIGVFYGESREEALDTENTLVYEKLTGKKKYTLIPRAMRYLFVLSASPVRVKAEYEFLPVRDRASFSCDDEKIGKIWDVCAYTFHLNSREFYLDGIKRDRWVWSGDAYQSYMANRYLYFDPEITKRTIIALLGKPPYEQHINTINDYSMYLIIGFYEYFEATGDVDFVKLYFPRIKALYDFISSRTDENGYICRRDGDWIFIDWSDMDKSAPMAAHQILFWRTKQVMCSLTGICGGDGMAYLRQADKLKSSIMRDFWCEEKHAFVDCLGSKHITRHPNIFAILYNFVSEAKKKAIVKYVLDNDEITAITTPYFEFFELCARCETGDIQSAQEKISSYWGGMLDCGATSVWEKYDPEEKGTEHYAMYGNKYGCSLCHAWGAGPIYLLGRYCLGVYPTDVGYKTFAVVPDRGRYSYIDGTAPLPDGRQVSVHMDDEKIEVFTDAEGGVLHYGGEEYAIEKGIELVITI